MPTQKVQKRQQEYFRLDIVITTLSPQFGFRDETGKSLQVPLPHEHLQKSKKWLWGSYGGRLRQIHVVARREVDAFTSRNT